MKLFLRLLLITTLVATPIVFFSASSASAAADTCTWTGATDGDWNDSANWSGCDNTTLPEDGDTLVFPSGPTNKTLNNDIPGLDLDNILISGDDYVITGEDIELSPTSSTFLQLSGSNVDFGLNTTLTKSGASAGLASSGVGNEISGDIILNITASADMNVGVSGTNELTFSGIISGTTQSFIISGDTGTAIYNGISTFTATGTMQINSGSGAVCGANDCLGIATNNLSLSGDAAFLLNTTSAIENDITFETGTDNGVILGILNNAAVDGNIVLNDDATIAAATSTALLVNGDVDLNTFTATYAGASGSQIVHNGTISGTGDVIVGDEVLLQMINPNSYSGSTTINAGTTLVASDTGSLGTDAGDTTIANGGTLQYNPFADVTDAEDITVEGDGDAGRVGALELFNTTNNLTLSGDITLTDSATFASALAGSANITLSGVISGTGDLTLSGPGGVSAGDFNIGGGTAAGSDLIDNSYSGTTYLYAIDLRLEKDANVNAIPNDIVATAIPLNPARITVPDDEQIADDAIVTIDSDASLGALVITGGTTETVGSVEGDGMIQLGTGTDLLNVGGGDQSGTFTGLVLGATGSIIEKIGTGTWDFQGEYFPSVFTYSDFTVTQGKLLANPSSGDLSTSNFTVDGGTLGGAGTVGPTTVNSGGTVNAGNSPGCLTIASLTLNSGSNFAQEITGTTACTGYDQITVTGAAALGNATLNMTVTGTPTAGAVYTIINAGSVSGTFNGLANDAILTSGTNKFKINYTSTSVTLTYVGQATLPETGTDFYGATLATLFALLLGGIVLVAFARSRRRIHFI